MWSLNPFALFGLVVFVIGLVAILFTLGMGHQDSRGTVEQYRVSCPSGRTYITTDVRFICTGHYQITTIHGEVIDLYGTFESERIQ